MMPKIDGSIEISATPEVVWSILADPANFLKLYPDAISVEADPPGMAIVGQKLHGFGKIAGRKVELFTEAVEVEPNKKLVARSRAGGIFKSFTATTLLEPTKKGTRVTNRSEWEPSLGYLGKILSALVVNRVVSRNIRVSLTNLKGLAELKGMPKTT